MSVAVVVPWGKPSGAMGAAREAAWLDIRAAWGRTDVDLIVAADPMFSMRGRFSVGRAINNAVRLAPKDYDRFVCFGADAEPCTDTVDWAAWELDTEPWTLLFDRGSEEDEDGLWSPVTRFPTPCVGPIAFTRKTFARVGGFDERYEGWGYEDVDLWYRLQRDAPRLTPQTYPGTALMQRWHPVTHHDLTADNPNVRLFAETWSR